MDPRRIRSRRNSLGAIVLVLFVVFAIRLIYVQAIKGPELAEAAREDRLRAYTISAPRGDIVDANGEILATSADRYNLAVNQRKIESFVLKDDDGEVVDTGASAAADLLAPILDRDPAELGGLMVGDSTWVYLDKGLTPTEWREIRALRIPGIEPERVSERIYPNSNTAGNIVGFMSRDGQPLAGLELAFDENLIGIDGLEEVEIGSGGQIIPTGTNDYTPAQPGDTLRLSVDRDVQHIAQDTLDETVRQYGAQWAGLAVMDLTTGGLVALAESGTVDPANPSDTPADNRGARSVSSPYEPGSTGKLLTIAAAVDQGLIDENSQFTVPDTMTFDGQTFSDPVDHPTEVMTTAGILAQSSNVGTVQIGNLMEDGNRFDYMQRFGFGASTRVGLPGESAGILYPPDSWDGRTRMTTMFGQGYAVTLVQNVAMVATIGNGGVFQTPHLVEEIRHSDGTVTVPERDEPHEVISPEAAETMIAMMEGVVQEGGTAPNAAIDGYRVAGKTGTAQTAGAGGGLTESVANFVGIVPADHPRFAVAVVVYKPQSGFYGGTIAAPAFQRVSEFALHTYGVEPSSGQPPKIDWIIE